MRSLAISSFAAAALLAVAPAQAQQGSSAAGSTYFGVSLSQVSYEETGRGTAKPTTIGIALGKVVNQNFALEGRFATGLTDDSVGGGGPQDVSVDFLLGAYAKGILPISPRFSLYGIAGVTYGDLSAGSGNLRFSGSDADFSYGIGVDYLIGATTSINFEWARLFDSSDYKLDALTVGLHFRF
jgi:opacity protein-like surface antigen